MHVVQLSAADVPGYRRLMLHAYEHAADAFTSTPEERAAEPDSWWAKRIAGEGLISAAFGAYEDGHLVGTVALEFSSKPKTKHKALLIGMYVIDAQRGAGVGRALLQAAVEYCKLRHGVQVITLTVTEGNASATALYQAFGFQAFGTEPMAILTPSGYKAKVHMWKKIAD